MQYRAIGLLLVLISLPAISQTHEVTVQRAKIVQVSSGVASPNIDGVQGSVTYIYISCTNVSTCGSDYVQGYQGTYNYSTAFSGILPSSDTYIPITWTPNLYGAALLPSALVGGLSTATIDANLVSDTSNWGALSHTFPNNEPIGITGALLGDNTKTMLSASPSTASVILDALYSVTNIYDRSGIGSSNSLVSSVNSDSNAIDAWSKSFIDYSSTHHVGLASGYLDITSQDLIKNIISTTPPSTTISLQTAYGSSQPIWEQNYESIVNASKQNSSGSDMTGILQNTSFGIPDSQSLTINFDYSARNIPQKFLSGVDKDSLTQQIERLSNAGKKIIGWTVVTEEDPSTN